MNSQDLILERIIKTLEGDHELLVANDRQYRNGGTLRTLNPNSLEQVAALSYDFQDNYCNFGPGNHPVAAHWYGQSDEGKADWVCGSIPELINSVVAELSTRKT